MKLRKKDRQRLESVLYDLERGISFILEPRTAIMRTHVLSSTDFFSSNFPEYAGEKWHKITKDIGNDFVIAIGAAQRLRTLLDEQETQ